MPAGFRAFSVPRAPSFASKPPDSLAATGESNGPGGLGGLASGLSGAAQGGQDGSLPPSVPWLEGVALPDFLTGADEIEFAFASEVGRAS